MNAVTRCPRTIEPGFYFQGGSLSLPFNWNAMSNLTIELSYKMVHPGMLVTITGPTAVTVAVSETEVS